MSIIRPYQELWDIPINLGSGEKTEFPRWFGNLVWVVAGVVLKLGFRYKVENKAAVKDFAHKSGVLLVAPHKSFFDVPFLYLACRLSQWPRLIARENLFSAAKGLGGFAFSRLGGFPIKRDSADRTAIKRAARMLKDGEVVGIFPEGTRRGKGSKSPELHAGAAFIARMGNAPLLPVCIRNVEYIKQKDKKMFRLPKITVVFGDALLLKDFDFIPKKERLEACSWYVMREAFALDGNVAAQQVDMKKLFPEAKDYSELFAEHVIPHYSAEEACRVLYFGKE